MRRRQRMLSNARATLFWTSACFLTLHLGVHLILETSRAEAYDPEYQRRLTLLQERLSEAPDRPLLLVVGSSRIATGFRPETMPELRTPDGRLPLAFNFSHTGAGPLLNLMEVERLLRRGIRPQWLVVEVLPAMLKMSGGSSTLENAESRDLALLSEHLPPWKVFSSYAWSRTVPSSRHYSAVLRPCMPDWFTPVDERLRLDPLGGACLFEDCDTESIRRRTDVMHARYYPALQEFHISAVADRSLRRLLDRCREENIPVALLLTPEASEFRNWYAPGTLELLEQFCGELTRDYDAPLIDARAWLDDGDFVDAHHTHPDGAVNFTWRLASDVLQPLVEGQLHGTR